ncbi:CubicO group peptidase (beta-lactamase class C family) [Pullulanibacillus pueri]|uniref:Serine hydrolase n=1 Tax=Pullulanibacillus pueri TaxID=1437324 RepID=A0A8J2ZZ63_9BACL|nr:serine hydrolase domain-containing protein [Pullulanibacillus pueri]MBM7683933.1 CubicO group peptidase (beta-lactamase class C family) [Pullulanibacillus pueri]GGH87900.1 serine hydrolase [Pullulanibacillus pueri]
MLEQTGVDQVKKLLRKSIAEHHIAGGNLLVVKEGEEIFYHEDGFADKEAGHPIQRDSIFRLYSMSKPVTATAMMILLERGDIDLLEPVSQFLDGFKRQVVNENGQLVPVRREMTIKDLLSMTSGLVYGGEHRTGQDTIALFREIDDKLLSDTPIGTVEAMNTLGEIPLAFHPGTSWEYGTSADVLGAVIEVVSGKSFGDFLQKELFEPLNMKDTGFWVPEEKRQRLVKVYEDNEQGELVPYTGNHLGINNQMDRRPAFESGGAGLVSTIDDYAKFTTMLMNGGRLDEHHILRPETVKYLTSATLNTVQQQSFDKGFNLSGHSYGNLMRVMTDPSQANMLGSLGEYGWDGWLGAYFCNCPNERLTFLFMMQKTDSGTTSLTRKLRNIILSAFE